MDFNFKASGAVTPERLGLQGQGVGFRSEWKDLQLRLEGMTLEVSPEQEGDSPSPRSERQRW